MRDNSGKVAAYCDSGLTAGSDCTGATPVNPVYEYSHDALGRAYFINNHYLNLGQTYGYNAFGDRKSMTVARGGDTLISFSYAYSPNDRLAEITDNRTEGVTHLSFTDAGRKLSITHSNDTHTDYIYSSTTGRLDSIDHLDSLDNSLLSLDYTYDPGNNIVSKTIDGVPTVYQYDLKSQLTYVSVDGTQTEAYTYDGKGNRLSSLEASQWSYNEGDELTGYDGHAFTYDQNGSMTSLTASGQEELFTYSVDDRLIEYQKVGLSGGTASYSYDYNELRVKREYEGVGATYYLFDGTVLLAELDSARDLSRYYLFTPGGYEPLEMVVPETGGLTPYIYHNDHLMTPQAVTDSDEQVVWSVSYKAFGEIISYLINNLPLPQPIRFPGQYQDPDMGSSSPLFVQNHFREYMTRLGRYSRKDPLYPFNYKYSSNNPFAIFDIFGLKCSSGNIDAILSEYDLFYSIWYSRNILSDNNYGDDLRHGRFSEDYDTYTGSPWPINCLVYADDLKVWLNTMVPNSCCKARQADRGSGSGFFGNMFNHSWVRVWCKYDKDNCDNDKIVETLKREYDPYWKTTFPIFDFINYY